MFVYVVQCELPYVIRCYHTVVLKNVLEYSAYVPVPVATRSKTSVYGRLPAEIVGSNPTEGMDVCLL
jgi:hypothetical protein